MTAPEPTPDLYFCPQAGEVESATHGGFDQCCEQPELHVPLPDGHGTEKLSQLLDRAARQEHAERKNPFQRMAEIAARAVNNALPADQTSFALAPSRAGDDARERYAIAIRALNEGGGTLVDLDDEHDVDALVDAVLAVRDRRMEQLAAGRATWKAKGEDMERDRDRLAAQVDQLISRLGQYADRAIANGGCAEAAAAALARVREYVETTDHDGIRTREAVLRILDDAGDRSSGKPRAGEPSGTADRP